MQIRFAAKEDRPALKSMWGYCFKDGDEYINWSFDRRFKETNCIVAEHEDKIASMLQIMPHVYKLMGQDVRSGYLEGVATMPNMRSMGIAKKMVSVVLEAMRNNDLLISFLIPYSFDYYRNLGYGVCSYLKKIEVSINDIKKYKSDGMFQIADLSEECINALDEVYRGYCTDKNAYLVRDKRYWEDIIQDACISGGNIYILYRDNGAFGYIHYTIKDDTILVNELAYLDFSAFSSIMKFIKNHSSQVERAILTVASCDPIYREFTNVKRSIIEYPFSMVRVIDVEKVLTMLSENFYGEVVLKIKDDQCAWNNQVYKISQKEVCIINEERMAEFNIDVSIDIQTFSELVVGQLSIREAKQMDRIIGDERLLVGLLFEMNNYMNLMFE